MANVHGRPCKASYRTGREHPGKIGEARRAKKERKVSEGVINNMAPGDGSEFPRSILPQA